MHLSRHVGLHLPSVLPLKFSVQNFECISHLRTRDTRPVQRTFLHLIILLHKEHNLLRPSALYLYTLRSYASSDGTWAARKPLMKTNTSQRVQIILWCWEKSKQHARAFKTFTYIMYLNYKNQTLFLINVSEQDIIYTKHKSIKDPSFLSWHISYLCYFVPFLVTFALQHGPANAFARKQATNVARDYCWNTSLQLRKRRSLLANSNDLGYHCCFRYCCCICHSFE
jgi:hypothetical protein